MWESTQTWLNQNGAHPDFVDDDPDSGELSPDPIEAKPEFGSHPPKCCRSEPARSQPRFGPESDKMWPKYDWPRPPVLKHVV